ncbi:MAG: ATP-binding protein [Paracoccaceae bacterium]|jgi:type II secretory pathway predicted ATPase ExeA|uniref:ATP-binding protein n=1 Tax=Pseudophaeobacter sp. TaxID=1971739 RepID=UPI0032649821
MAYLSEIGNAVRPLTNVARMAGLIEELKGRVFGAPGFGVFHGPPGYGKSFGAIFCADKMDVIHLVVQSEWSKSFFLQQLLHELGRSPKGTVPALVQAATQALALESRPLIIDEADYLVSKKLTGIVRDLHDGSQVPILLIGEEDLPQKLRRFTQLDSRIMSYAEALPADLKDTRELADIVTRAETSIDISIDDEILEVVRERHTGNARWIVKEIAHICKHAKRNAIGEVTLESWGGLEFMSDTAPVPRGGLK